MIDIFTGEDAYHSLKVAVRKAGKEHIVQELNKVIIEEDDLRPTEGTDWADFQIYLPFFVTTTSPAQVCLSPLAYLESKHNKSPK